MRICKFVRNLFSFFFLLQMGVCKSKNELEDHAYYEKVWKSLDYGPPQPPPRPPQRSSSLSGESAPLSEPKVSSVYVDTLLVLLF